MRWIARADSRRKGGGGVKQGWPVFYALRMVLWLGKCIIGHDVARGSGHECSPRGLSHGILFLDILLQAQRYTFQVDVVT